MNTLSTTIIEFDLITHTHKQLALDKLDLNSANKSKIFWVHFDLSQKDGTFEKIAEKLNLPIECIELCAGCDYLPKLIDMGQGLIIQAQDILNSEYKRNQEIDFSNLVIYLTDYFCFTASNQTLPAMAQFYNNYHKSLKYAKTPCFILFLIFDSIIENYSKILFDIETEADQIDLEIRTKKENIYVKVAEVKKQILQIKRYIVAVRDILMRSSGRKIEVISDQCQISLYNLYTQAETIVHEADSIREILNSILDQSDNALMQKMNRTMQVLTSFAAIFLPLTLIAGIYGMNFHWIPELSWKYGYFGALFLMALCGLGLFFLFRKKEWV